MIPSNELDIFPEGDPSARWSRSYWKEKLKHADVVDKISKQINANDFKPAPDKYPQQPSDYFQEGATVKTVIKPRNLQEESLDFFKAQHDISTDILPKQTTATKAPPTPTGQDATRIRTELYDFQWHRNEDTESYSQNSTLTLDIPNKSGTITDQQNMFPKKAKASKNEMTISVNDAFTKIFPHGNPYPQSAAMKPTSELHSPGPDIVVTADQKPDSGSDGIPSHYVGTIQLEEKSGANTRSVGDNYLPKESFDSGFTPPQTQLSSGDESKAWDGVQYTDLNFQGGLGKVKQKSINSFGDMLQKAIEDAKLKLTQ